MELDQCWGPHTINRFADHQNSKLPRFNYRCWCPGTEAVDAFTCDWKDINWVCPPPYLVPGVIWHAQKASAVGTLLVPCWPSAPYWPMIYTDGLDPANFVTNLRVLAKDHQPVLMGRSGHALPACDMLAIQFKFK